MITILSYHPGFSGDFIASQIHKNDGYINIKLQPNNVNRYVWPCLTERVFGWEIKNTKLQTITKDNMDILNQVYNYQHMILPTHQFKPVYNNELNFIRLHSSNLDIVKLSFAMWLFKSHIINDTPWPERLSQIKNTPEPVRTELIKKFHKWKYLCYKHNLNKNNKFDVEEYIKGYFEIYKQKCDITVKYRDKYRYFDIQEIVYDSNTTKLENYLNVTLNKHNFTEYATANYKLLKDNSIDLYSNNFINQLILSVKDSMMETMDLTDYEPRNYY